MVAAPAAPKALLIPKIHRLLTAAPEAATLALLSFERPLRLRPVHRPDATDPSCWDPPAQSYPDGVLYTSWGNLGSTVVIISHRTPAYAQDRTWCLETAPSEEKIDSEIGQHAPANSMLQRSGTSADCLG
ncbi:hypothetical protein NDU88_004919 [Pleurodeles waltl]|uniref:Uncharacterized protein n=1 Tax=Pleurodeles waltl TaxID=8319 RepID=A0AAV7T8Z3_PLEWA|nr:hypothetical protein NDU88_004919 [Pleurodeles waltl]